MKKSHFGLTHCLKGLTLLQFFHCLNQSESLHIPLCHHKSLLWPLVYQDSFDIIAEAFDVCRYKEERRRQLAAHVASRLGSNPSSSEEDDEQADRRSYTEFRFVIERVGKAGFWSWPVLGWLRLREFSTWCRLRLLIKREHHFGIF